DAQARQNPVAGMPHRPVDAVRDQHMVAGREAGEEGGGGGRKPGWKEHRAGSAADEAKRLFQRFRGWRSTPSVDVRLRVVDEVMHARREDRRAMIDRPAYAGPENL